MYIYFSLSLSLSLYIYIFDNAYIHYIHTAAWATCWFQTMTFEKYLGINDQSLESGAMMVNSVPNNNQ